MCTAASANLGVQAALSVSHPRATIPCMSISDSLQAKLEILPTRPGCYLMKSADGTIIYVGKAINLRARVRELAQGKAMLNLFCYTGSFSVYAAAGGASLVHSVDLSAKYLGILEENLKLNGLQNTPHENIRLDSREYLQQTPAQFYDIIVCDPPVFSRSRKQERDFDVLRDHPQLIRDCLRVLKPGGVLFFSTNFRKFRIRFPEEGDGYQKTQVKNITAQTIPEDFRNKWIHACYEIRHGA